MKRTEFKRFSIATLVMVVAFTINLFAQVNDTVNEFQFEVLKEVKTTSVKNQYRSGTCWAFATLSFLESEILRIKGEEYDLSEMFIVKHTYPVKAVNYVRYHGNTVFGAGGQAHDATDVIREYGIVPEIAYDGMEIDEDKHNHGEMDAVLKAIVEAVSKNRGGKVTPVWLEAFEAVLEAYLGEEPKSFEYKAKTYTPKDFQIKVGINPDDYVEITSFIHHPFYSQFRLEIPDNWTHDDYYNVPVDDLLEVMKNALENGYSIAWDGDVSEKNFSFKNGVAIIPAKEYSDKSDEEKSSIYKKPESEKDITEEMRQETFDNFQTTDDHLMHIVALVKDQNGTYYFKTKNSWSEEANEYGGYIYISEAYVRLKTIAIMVHKDAIPKSIAKKFSL